VFGGLLLDGAVALDSQFDLSALGGFLLTGSQTMDSLFIITANGDILWVQVDAGATTENWTPITHTGDSWVQINAGTSPETWTNKVA